MSDNLALWNQVKSVDPQYSKANTPMGSSGFRGTAINPMYSIKKATELWGPCGVKWGWEIVSDTYTDAAPIVDESGRLLGHEKLHSVVIKLWYPLDSTIDGESARCTGEVFHSGGTKVCWRDKYKNLVSDDDHKKKSITDALSKALSILGFNSDVWMGEKGFEDTKFQVKAEPGRRIELPAEADEQSLNRAKAAVENAPSATELLAIYNRYHKPTAGYSSEQIKELDKLYEIKKKSFGA